MGAPAHREAADRDRVHLFGYHPWAWRLAPALAGTALAGVFLLLARRVLRSERAAVLATTLLLCDGVFLVQSRVAMTNVFAVLFQLLAALLVVRAAAARRLGLGAMGPPRAGARARALHALDEHLRRRLPGTRVPGVARAPAARAAGRGRAVPRARSAREAALVVLAFALVPAALYLLSYVPGCSRRILQPRASGGSGSATSCACSATSGATTPTCGRRTPTSARVDVAVPVPANLVLLVGRRRCRAGHHRARHPAIWWDGPAGGRLGPAQRLAIARRASPLRRQRLLHAVPALGGSRAHAHFSTTCSRRSPTLASRSACCSIAPGRPQAPRSPSATSRPWSPLLRLPAAS